MITRARSGDGQLFPTRAAFVIFWSYITLFVNQGLLTKAVQLGQLPGFNNAIIVLLVELVKLCICIGVYLLRSQGSGLAALLHDVKSNKKLLSLYLIPAFLYCLYNNLTFINLEFYDVSTYYCLMQFRVVLTAVIYQILFKRQLNCIQWTSLLILTTGCVIKQVGIANDDGGSSANLEAIVHHNATTPKYSQSESIVEGEENLRIDEEPKHDQPFKLLWSTGLILLQMFCSCFAGVYNEYLLKDSKTAKSADVILQNMFMYLDSILCNLIVYCLSVQSQTPSVANGLGLMGTLVSLLGSPLVIVLILNNALAGLVASFFLSSLNSILKTFASALELFAATFLAWILFRDRVDRYTIIALVLVSAATVIYSKNPVSVAPPAEGQQFQSRDGFVLLPIDENHEEEQEQEQ